jgi:nitroreductase
MEFFDVLSRRHSVREFSNRKIVEPELNKILKAADTAPSAGNLQSYEIVIIRSQQHKVALAKAAYDQNFIAGAPAILVFCADPGRSAAKYDRRGAELFCIQDATIAASYAQLAATALGLATVWIGAFDETLVAKIVGGLKPVCVLPIGYPATKPDITPRRELEELVHQEHL